MPNLQVIRTRPDTRKQALGQGIANAGKAIGGGLRDYAKQESDKELFDMKLDADNIKQEEADWQNAKKLLSNPKTSKSMREMATDFLMAKGFFQEGHRHYAEAMAMIQKAWTDPEKIAAVEKQTRRILDPSYKQSPVYFFPSDSEQGGLTDADFGEGGTQRAGGMRYIGGDAVEGGGTIFDRERHKIVLSVASNMAEALALDGVIDGIAAERLPGVYTKSAPDAATALYLKDFPVDTPPKPDGEKVDSQRGGEPDAQRGEALGGALSDASGAQPGALGAQPPGNNMPFPAAGAALGESLVTSGPSTLPSRKTPSWSSANRGLVDIGPDEGIAGLVGGLAPRGQQPANGLIASGPSALPPSVAPPSSSAVRGLVGIGPDEGFPGGPQPGAVPQPTAPQVQLPQGKNPAEWKVIDAFTKAIESPTEAIRGADKVLVYVLATYPPADLQAIADALNKGATAEQIVQILLKRHRGI